MKYFVSDLHLIRSLSKIDKDHSELTLFGVK